MEDHTRRRRRAERAVRDDAPAIAIDQPDDDTDASMLMVDAIFENRADLFVGRQGGLFRSSRGVRDQKKCQCDERFIISRIHCPE